MNWNSRKWMLIALALTLFNVFGFVFFVKDESSIYMHNDVWHHVRSALSTLLIAIPLLSLFLSVLISFIPYENRTYSEKYKRNFWFILNGINAIVSVFMGYTIIFTLIGWYPNKQVDIRLSDQELIAHFKKDVKASVDSGNFYFELAIKDFNNGMNKDSISNKYGPPLHRLEESISNRLALFAKQCKEQKIPVKEYDQAIKEVTPIANKVIAKYDYLAGKGIHFKQ
jgi:hypothetical protein